MHLNLVCKSERKLGASTASALGLRASQSYLMICAEDHKLVGSVLSGFVVRQLRNQPEEQGGPVLGPNEMEQRGRNRWQTFGSPEAPKRLDLARNCATGCHRLPFWIAW
jgi:hypothetical protein